MSDLKIECEEDFAVRPIEEAFSARRAEWAISGDMPRRVRRIMADDLLSSLLEKYTSIFLLCTYMK